MRALVIFSLLLGCADTEYADAKPTKPTKPTGRDVVCGTDAMEKQVASVLTSVAPALVKLPVDMVVLSTVEKQASEDVLLCALQRSAALAAGLGGPQYPEAEVLRDHAKSVRVNVSAIIAKHNVVFVPFACPRCSKKQKKVSQ